MTAKAKLPKGLTFEKALERLEKIVAELEDPERGLEASLELFEEGVVLSRFCRGKLDEIQKRVDVVLKETPGGPRDRSRSTSRQARTTARAEDGA